MVHDLVMPPLARHLAGGELPPWTREAHGSRASTQPVAASFAASLDRWVRGDHLEHAAGGQPLAWRLRNRERVSAWLRDAGFQVARIHASGFPLAELPDHLAGLQRLVVKPVDGHSSLGVMALLRDGGGMRFVDVETGRRHDLADLLDVLAKPLEAFDLPDRWQVEDLLVPPSGVPEPLPDFKFYAFRGHVPLVLQARGRDAGRRHRWLDGQWQPVRTGKYEDSLDDELAPAADPDALLETAQRLSRALRMPFCRIDLYETSIGVVVGELTPEPGEYHRFSEEVDHHLGACFEQAEAELIRSGQDDVAP